MGKLDTKCCDENITTSIYFLRNNYILIQKILGVYPIKAQPHPNVLELQV